MVQAVLPATPEGTRASAFLYFSLGVLGSATCLLAFQWLEHRSTLMAHYNHRFARGKPHSPLHAGAEVEEVELVESVESVESEPLRAGPLSYSDEKGANRDISVWNGATENGP